MKARTPATEMITEIYVPRPSLVEFMDDAREVLRGQRANVVYGTVRLIERDDESFLTWATQPFACVIFNLHVEHTEDEIDRAAETFRSLIDLGIAYRGSYYLTYHRWARKDQVERCYPAMRRFLALRSCTTRTKCSRARGTALPQAAERSLASSSGLALASGFEFLASSFSWCYHLRTL